MSDRKLFPGEPDIVDPDDIAVTLELDDGSLLECGIVSIFTVGEQDYIALLPYGPDGDMDYTADIYFYRFFEDASENASIDNIESDEEFEAVKAAFEAL